MKKLGIKKVVPQNKGNKTQQTTNGSVVTTRSINTVYTTSYQAQ